MKFYYFGCIGDTGHYMFSSVNNCDHDFLYSNPWGVGIDSGLCVKGKQIEGLGILHHKDGWTALSFWDRSVDGRPGSNSNFIAEGTFTFIEIIEFAKQYFPKVFNRFKFEIIEQLEPPDD